MALYPYTRVEGSSASPYYYKQIIGYRQKPYANKVVPCQTSVWKGDGEFPIGRKIPIKSYIWQEGQIPTTLFPTADSRTGSRAVAYNKARANLMDEVKLARASLLTACVERKKTMEMVNSRLLQLLKAARAVRKGNFEDFLKALNVRPLTKHRNKGWNRPREAAGLWLEYWMGWAPTIGDVYNGINAYTNEVNDDFVKAGSSAYGESVFDLGDGSTRVLTRHSYKSSAHLGGLVEVTNPDLLDLNEAGLLNPALTALEVIPFSWLLGWFNNLDDVVGSFTDTLGLSFKEFYLSEKLVASVNLQMTERATGKVTGWRDLTRVSFKRSRITDLPAPSLTWQLPKTLSATRGATLASLIVQLKAPK